MTVARGLVWSCIVSVLGRRQGRQESLEVPQKLEDKEGDQRSTAWPDAESTKEGGVLE